MEKTKVSPRAFWRALVSSLLVVACAGCGKGMRERVTSELHFELQPVTSPNACFPDDRSQAVREYFAREELHVELGHALGRTAGDVGNSLAVDALGDSYDRFTLRAEGKDSDEAGVLARAALSHFENHLIDAQQRSREESIANLERQIELQKLKVAAAKAEMDAAYEKIKDEDTEDK